MAIKDTIIKGRSDSITRPSQRIDSCHKKAKFRAARNLTEILEEFIAEKRKTEILKMCKIVILTVAALALISGQALAQDTPAKPVNCIDVAKSLDWNNTALFTRWLEMARNPSDNTDACMEFNVELLKDNTTLSFNTSHSETTTSLWQNINEPPVHVKLVENATTGYNVTFNANKHVFIKLLNLASNDNYLVGCGYTNASDRNSSYGFILGRDGQFNATTLKLVNNNASVLYSDFASNNFSTILQQGCTRNSASQSLPLISGFLALALLLIKAH